MKRTLCSIALLINIAAFVLADTEDTKTIAIMPFTGEGTTSAQKLDTLSLQWTEADAQHLAKQVTKRIKGQPNTQIIEPHNLEVLERAIARDTFTHAADIATTMGIDYLVYGNVENYEIEKQSPFADNPDQMEARMSYKINIMDVKNSNVLLSQTLTESAKMPIVGAKLDRLSGIIKRQVVKTITGKLLDLNTPIIVEHVHEGYLYITPTSTAQLTPGTELDICIPCMTHFDAASGKIAGDSEFSIGKARVVDTKETKVRAQILNFKMPVKPGAKCHIIRG